jgi:hypothetical protein
LCGNHKNINPVFDRVEDLLRFLQPRNPMPRLKCPRVLVLALVLSGCGLGLDRAAAIDACAANEALFAGVPNPSAGQQKPDISLSGTPSPFNVPRYEPNFLAPNRSQIQQRIAYIRSRSVASGDKRLERQADNIKFDNWQTTALSGSAAMGAYCREAGYWIP